MYTIKLNIISFMSLGQIIRKRRESLNLTLDEVAAYTGFSKPYLSTVETGKVNNPPSDRLLVKIEEMFDLDPGTLQRIAHIERMPADVRHDYESADAENKRYRKLINDIIRHKPRSKKLEKILNQYDLDLEIETEPQDKAGQLVPVINKVPAGYPADFDDMGYPVGFADDYVRCPDIHDPNAFAVRVVGDSMESKFFEGDIVIFSPAADVQNGDDCFIRLESPHETTFKRVFFDQDDSVRLQPRNEMLAPLLVDSSRINGIYRAVIHYQHL